MFALIRPVSSAMERCELTHIERSRIDIAKAHAQHTIYAQALESLGCQLVGVAPAPELPDAVFVEDTVVVVDELAVLTRPGAPSRQPEVAAVAKALAPFRECITIAPPGTLEGGDVLRIGRDIYVGISGRTNRSGIEQLANAIKRFGYRVTAVAVQGCLHLKSAVTQVGARTLLINDAWVDRAVWPNMNFVAVAPEEPSAANALHLGETVIYSAAAVRTRDRLEAAGIRVLPIEVTELEKAEGAVTCCSVLFT